MDPHYHVLRIISSTLTYVQKKGISNNNFGDTVLDQILATTSQCSVFVFGENYHAKVLRDNGGLTLANYHILDRSGENKYYSLARKLVASRFTVKNNQSSRARTYLKDQYFLNQANCLDKIIEAVTMIISFGKNSGSSGSGGGGDKNTSETDAIVSLHLADDSNNYFNDNDGPIGSFESKVSTDGKTSNDNVSIADAPFVASKLGNDNINDDVATGNNDDGIKDDNNEAGELLSNNDDDDSSQEEPVSNSVSASSAWMQLVALASDNVENGVNDAAAANGPDNWIYLQSDYDLDADGVYNNNNTDANNGFVCMTLTGKTFDEQYVALSIHSNFFNDTINNSRG